MLPPPHWREVAFAGRSNAGKSSAINALTQRNRSHSSSKTPGRTQHINFFASADERYLVDLPGYGYAARAASGARAMGRARRRLSQTRDVAARLVLIMDVRHPLTRSTSSCSIGCSRAAARAHTAEQSGQARPAQALARRCARSNAALARGYANAACSSFRARANSVSWRPPTQIQRWLSDRMRKKNPRLKGSKAGGESLNWIKAPAQGGEAGDDETSSKLWDDYNRHKKFPCR